jgi:hypothetical protein
MRAVALVAALLSWTPPVSSSQSVAASSVAVDSTKEWSQKDREEMERRFRERLEQLVREQLGLNEDKIKSLRGINDQFRPQYRLLWDKMGSLRKDLRAEMDKEAAANQQRIDDILNESWEVELQRHMLVKAEQRELSKVLTPLQRAKYWSIQGQLWREIWPRGGNKSADAKQKS